MTTDTDKAAIRAVLESIDKAHHDRDAAAIIAPYLPDAVIYDLAPPLARKGLKQADVAAWLDTWDGPVELQSKDIEITVSGDYAFCHGFYRTSAISKPSMERAIFWNRVTICFRRDGDGWKIVHDHSSVPFYMDGSFGAAVDLEP